MKKVLVSDRAEEIRSNLVSAGQRIELIWDPEIASEMMKQVGKESMHPVSEICRADLLSGRAFWVAIHNGEKYIACISARLTEIQGKTFGEYWSSYCAQKYPGRKSPVCSVIGAASAKIHGRAVYLGGVEVSSENNGNIRRLRLLVEYTKLCAARSWDFDCLYTIINPEHRPLARVYKFGEALDSAVSWVKPAPLGLHDDQIYLVESRAAFFERLGA